MFSGCLWCCIFISICRVSLLLLVIRPEVSPSGDVAERGNGGRKEHVLALSPSLSAGTVQVLRPIRESLRSESEERSSLTVVWIDRRRVLDVLAMRSTV